MASLEEINGLIRKEKAIKDGERGDSDTAAALQPNSQMGGIGDFASGVARGGMGSLDLMSFSPPFAGMQGATTLLRPLVDRFAPEVPDSVAGRYGERLGAGLPFLPAGGAAGMGVRGIAGLVATEIAASGAGQALEEAGYGAGAQMAAEVAVGVASPGTVARGYQRASKQSSAAVRRLAKKLGVSESAIMRAGEFHRLEDIPIVPGTKNTPDLAPVRDRLRAAVRDFPDPKSRITTRQALSSGDDSNIVTEPVGIAMREKAMARGGTANFRNRLAGRREAIAREVESEYERFLPNGSYTQAQASYKASFDASSEAASDAWANVDLDKMPMVRTARLKEAARKVKARIGDDHAEHVPAAVEKILAMPDEIPASRLQTFRSGELLAQRAGSRAAADTASFTKAKNSGPIMEALRIEVADLPDKGGANYRKALAATRRHYDIFDAESAGARVINSIDDSRKAVQTLRRSGKKVEDVRKLKRAFADDPESWEGFKRAVIDELADEELGNRSLGSMNRTLRQNKEFYTEVLGADGYGQLNKVLKKLRRATAGFEGTAGSVERTGSGMNRVGAAIRGLAGIMSGGMMGAAEAADVVSALGKRVDEMGLNQELMEEFMLDPETALIVLEAPTEKTLVFWAGAYDLLLSRALTRRAVKATPPAAARSLGPNERSQTQN